MPQLTLIGKFKKDTGIVMSPDELWSLYLYGVSIQSQDGTDFSNENIRFHVLKAQTEIENVLKIKLQKQLIEDERITYNRDEYWWQFPIIKTKWPVRSVETVIGMLNKIEQIVFPKSWFSYHNNQEQTNKRRISLVPTGAGTAIEGSGDMILAGITSQIGFQRFNAIPDYWTVQYVTGFDYDKIPFDVLDVIGKLASIGLFNIAGDLILGAGIASQSLGIDGLSQSISSTSSATNAGYGARIVQYQKEIKESLQRLKHIYGEIDFIVL
jgi:hypothetical protein